MAKLVDAPDLGSGVAIRGGSSPFLGTTFKINNLHLLSRRILFVVWNVLSVFCRVTKWLPQNLPRLTLPISNARPPKPFALWIPKRAVFASMSAPNPSVFFLRRQLDGRLKPVKLGECPAMTVSQARPQAEQLIAQIPDHLGVGLKRHLAKRLFSGF